MTSPRAIGPGLSLLLLQGGQGANQEDRTKTLESALTVLPWHVAACVWNGMAEHPKDFEDMFGKGRSAMSHEEFMEFIEKNNIVVD